MTLVTISRAVIDLHSHVLPGLDDGAVDLDESLRMLRAMEEDGVRVVAATPHVRSDFPTTAAQMRGRLDEVRTAAAAAGLSIEVVAGAEIAIPMVDALDRSALRELGLGGNPDLLLVEFPYGEWPYHIESRVEHLRADGFRIVLAHPERNDRVMRDPRLLRDVVAAGAAVQVTAASLDGRLGRGVRKTALRLLEEGLVHLVASDAHAPEVRAAGLGAALNAVGDRALARWLAEDVPRALLAGQDLPPRPVKRSSRLRWRP